MKNIKVAIADDHTLFVKGMASIIKGIEGIELIIEASDGMDLLDKLQRRSPHVILMDLKMPGMDGMKATQHVVAQYPKIKIIALTMHDETRFVQRMLELGAHGYMLKNAEPEEVEKGIRKVLKNDFFFSENLSNNMLPEALIKGKGKKEALLTDREKEILKLICNEHTSAEIGKKLFMSPRTAEGYRKKLLELTGARNTAGLVVYAFKNELTGTS